ncbi:MAG: hypothetical protein M3Y87_27715, partial [Myxococcota bacterium]|nr:hypothetical protein [Myxococcota bacterium]
ADAPVGLVTLTLAAPDAGAPGCEGTTCVDGECLERCEVEGAACLSSGAAGVCRDGACCTGCWNGESCLPGTPAVELSAGETFTCMRTGDGRVACWGSNGQGELGDGTRGGTTSASWRADARTLDVPEGTIFSSVVAGVASGYAIDTEGGLWAWGWNRRGQLGLGDAAIDVNAFSPVRVPHPLGSAWDRVVAPHTHDDRIDPDLHACAFSRGELWCWGANEEGQVDPTQAVSARDAIVSSPRRIEGLFADVAITQRATCAILMDGAGVSCWGDNTRGTLGTGDAEPRAGIVPVPLPDDAGRIVELAGGVAGFCARSEVGRVFCWGDAVATSLPLEPGTLVRAVAEAPTLSMAVAASTEDERLAVGRGHGGALTGGAPWVWGSNVDGRLALGAAAVGSTLPPGPTAAYPGVPATTRELRVGSYHTCARLDDGTLACAGANDLGQLGVPMTRPVEPEWQRYCPCIDCGL